MSRVKLSTGTLPSSQIEQLATSHPFVQQIDIVFPSRAASKNAFTSLKTTYSTAQFTLSELYEFTSHLPIPNVPFKALPIQRNADDTWCIDPRGILTLSVPKTLYEQLGLVGKKLPFKGSERYMIEVPLTRGTVSVAVQARQRAALAIWDRARAAVAGWRVAYIGAGPSSPRGHTTIDVSARTREETDVYVPRVGDLVQSSEETAEDHQERLEALFEWVGMASLGAQRLCANDRVDPYVAVYEPPSPASIGEVTHLRYKGLMDSAFVRSVIDAAISVVSTSSGDNNPFISITLHSNLDTPVAYVPNLGKEAPLRVPGRDAEDTVCVMLSKTVRTSSWAIGQSIGPWDARWG